MESDNFDTRPLTLADIFLEVLEQKSNDESQKAYIRKVKTLMDVPECAEYLSFGLMNAMGNPTPIAASTVDKAVDCITHFYEDNIEENQELTREEMRMASVKRSFFIIGVFILLVRESFLSVLFPHRRYSRCACPQCFLDRRKPARTESFVFPVHA